MNIITDEMLHRVSAADFHSNNMEIGPMEPDHCDTRDNAWSSDNNDEWKSLTTSPTPIITRAISLNIYWLAHVKALAKGTICPP